MKALSTGTPAIGDPTDPSRLVGQTPFRWQLALLGAFLVTAIGPLAARCEPFHLPYREAGLSDKQAAAHLVSRFTFGARPGDVERVVAMGLEAWFEAQLEGIVPEPRLDVALASLDTLELPAQEIPRRYPNPGRVMAEARRESERSANREAAGGDIDRRQLRDQALTLARQRGYRPQRELLDDLRAAKLLRAQLAENQLREVLADFWANHFYVSLADPETRSYLLPFERDAIRPRVLGRFRDLLGATAHHPAMLLYLDNARSRAGEGAATTLARSRRGGSRPARRTEGPGLNENYARELLELQTLGVDGGYSQEDVVEVARAFTGWTMVPPEGPKRQRVEAALARWGPSRISRMGFVLDGQGFLFRADAHDAGGKRVLGHTLAPGRGIEDGEEVLDLLARHPATARHLAHKLAVRFVSDDPPERLERRLAAVFLDHDGDLEEVLRALVASPEMWSEEARGAKIKSPFELAVSALRATEAKVWQPRRLVGWIERMGQPLYAYPAPNGYPDRAEEWLGTGAMVSRMRFGLELAVGEILGARLDLDRLLGPAPGTCEEALRRALEHLLPAASRETVVDQLRPALACDADTSPDLSRIVGLILGSPEFQRR